MPTITPAELADHLLSIGVTSATVSEAAAVTGQSEAQARQSLKRLLDKGKMVSPARGLYVPVPPEFREWGAPPAAEFVDSMMEYLGRRYYTGLLSAAEIHGVAHQRPQAFQIVVDRQLSNRRVGRSRLQFLQSSRIEDVPTVAKTVRTGRLLVSSVEATILDLAFRPGDSGGLDNVATILGEIVSESLLNESAIASSANLYPATAVRRVGWIFDRVLGIDLREYLDPRDSTPSKLDPHGDRRGHVDEKWGIIVNSDVNPDL